MFVKGTSNTNYFRPAHTYNCRSYQQHPDVLILTLGMSLVWPIGCRPLPCCYVIQAIVSPQPTVDLAPVTIHDSDRVKVIGQSHDYYICIFLTDEISVTRLTAKKDEDEIILQRQAA